MWSKQKKGGDGSVRESQLCFSQLTDKNGLQIYSYDVNDREKHELAGFNFDHDMIYSHPPMEATTSHLLLLIITLLLIILPACFYNYISF